MTARSRVLIACRQLLLARAIEGALKSENRIEVVACERIAADLSERIQALRPEVLILDRQELAGVYGCIGPEICRENPGLKVIVIEHGANVVDIFRMEHRQTTVRDPVDIVELVLGKTD